MVWVLEILPLNRLVSVNFWDFGKSGDTHVDEDDLPFKLPPGMSREKRDVAEYLGSIAQDRVRNILHGVCQACSQAGMAGSWQLSKQ